MQIVFNVLLNSRAVFNLICVLDVKLFNFQMRSMLTYLEAARYKVHSTLAELNGDRRGSHPLASHIQVTRDRQGLQQSVLKVRIVFFLKQ